MVTSAGLCWGRVVRVVIGPVNQTTQTELSSVGSSDASGFRIAFEVAKKDQSASNQATVKIWGLAKSTIEQLRKPLSSVQLYAGYGDVVPLVYKGIVTRVKVELEGAEVVCVIESQKDYLSVPRPTQSSAATTPLNTTTTNLPQTINRTLSGQVGLVEGLELIWEDTKQLAGAFALAMAKDFSQLAGASTSGRPAPAKGSRGLRLEGTPTEVLAKYAQANNLDIWMEDGVLRAVAKGQASRERAFVLSPNSGLVGSPKAKLSGKDQRGAGAVEVTVLLNPELRVRRTVQISGTKELSGWYLIRAVRHTGDSGWDTAYYSELELTPLKARPAPPKGSARATRAKAVQSTAPTLQAGEQLLAREIQAGPHWTSYSQAAAEVRSWWDQALWDQSPTYLGQLPDGRWSIATAPVVARAQATGNPQVYPLYRRSVLQ